MDVENRNSPLNRFFNLVCPKEDTTRKKNKKQQLGKGVTPRLYLGVKQIKDMLM